MRTTLQTTLLAGYLILAALAGLLIVWGIPATTPHYSGYGMHPAVLPYMLATLLLVCMLICAWKVWRSQEGADEPTPLPMRRWKHLMVYTVVLLAAMPMMEQAGFFLGSVVVLAALQWLAGQRNLVVLTSVAVGVSGVTWAVLWYGLKAPLP